MSIFVSYSHLDKNLVQKLVNDLRENEFSVWFDEDSIFPGEQITKAIAEGLDSSQVVLVILSENSVVSNWVEEELGGALHRALNDSKRHIIPILVDSCELPSMLVNRRAFELFNYSSQLPDLIKSLREIEECDDNNFINIPGYQSFKLIGEGGFNIVYKAFSEKRKQYCAIKIAKSHVLSLELEKKLQKLMQESPYIVPVIASGKWRKRPYIVMPYVGHSLKWHLRHDQIKPSQIEKILEVAIGILEGLDSAHSNGIVHCDIKPSNILIDEIGNPLICDFGLAYKEHAIHFKYTTMVRGTMCYMSPEQQQAMELDVRTDIYSFGAVFYEMLTGVKPVGRFEDPSAINTKIPFSVEKIVNKCLETKIEKRYSSVKKIIAEIDAAKGDLSLARRLKQRQNRRKIIIISSTMKDITGQLARFTNLDIDCLLLGPTGVGKTVLARWAHEHSPRKGGPFVEVNSSTITETLATSELFGHEKGAFTGATSKRRGLIAAADGGTLFIDEVGDMPITIQKALLRILETGKFQLVGGAGNDTEVDVRWIFATNRDLKELVDKGKFRADLLARIPQSIRIPSLSERPDEIVPLLEAFADSLSYQITFTESAIKSIVNYEWPENIRQLDNFITYLLAAQYTKKGILTVDEHIFKEFLSKNNERYKNPMKREKYLMEEVDSLAFREAKEHFEQAFFKRALEKYGGNISKTAMSLQLDRSYLRSKLKSYGLLGS